MYIARKITDSSKFNEWRFYGGYRFQVLTSELDAFSLVIDSDESSRALKRRIYDLFHDQFEEVLIFREVSLFPHLLAFNSYRVFGLHDRWRKWI